MVDDSSADRTLCRILLEEEYGDQLDFVEAPNARVGLQLCALCERPPDCLLLDYKLPDLTGVEFLRRLDKRQGGRHARPLTKDTAPTDLPDFAVVMLTGLGNEQVAAEAMRAGAQDYLVKDRITAESLRLAIEKATGKVGLLRTLQSERDRLTHMLAEKQSLLDEKDALLQEVQHRVKNNLQVIASLLRMQADKFAEGENAPRVFAALRESQNRVESMALIHEQLYQAGNLREVDLAEHAALLAGHLVHAYAADPGRIQCLLHMERLPVGVDRAIPAALILNELVSNALKHAFPNDRRGVIEIAGGRGPGDIFLEVRDNGVGLAASTADPASGESLGLDIVRILTGQLRGKFTIQNAQQEGGAVCRLAFPSASPSRGERPGKDHASRTTQAEPEFLRHSAG